MKYVAGFFLVVLVLVLLIGFLGNYEQIENDDEEEDEPSGT
jgi:hypothetical protein